jgi:hypothetical protein
VDTSTGRLRQSHIWEREANEHYVEPAWCSERLFQAEEFRGAIHDPCCGFGTIPESARRAGLIATASDLVDRGYAECRIENFFDVDDVFGNIVGNPPPRCRRGTSLRPARSPPAARSISRGSSSSRDTTVRPSCAGCTGTAP